MQLATRGHLDRYTVPHLRDRFVRSSVGLPQGSDDEALPAAVRVLRQVLHALQRH